MSNNFPYPVYPQPPDISLKDIYPVGSIIILTEPLMGKDRWEVTIDSNNYEDPELLVEWEGMTWEYIQSSHNLSQPFVDYSSEKHVLQNCHVHLHFKELIDDHTTKYTAALVPGPEGPAYHDGFYYDNHHNILEAEMPSHSHQLKLRGSASSAAPVTEWTPYVGYEQATGVTTTESTGGNQPMDIQQHAYFVYMYRRVS